MNSTISAAMLMAVLLTTLPVQIAVARPTKAAPSALDEDGSLQSDPLNVYQTQIKPLLRERCFACHGALKQEAGLRLDTVELILHGGDSGPVIVTGDPDAGTLLHRVSSADPADRMPPEFEGEALSAEQIELVRTWIAANSPAPDNEQPEADPGDHWAFQPVIRPPVPELPDGSQAQTPIDAFIASKQEHAMLAPLPVADRLTLLRRVSFDLTGLPPTPAEIDDVLTDTSADWYERTVTRLLDDPRHGERWARHWMDIWRYSDWWGLGDQLRNSQPHIWHWRDWIVESLNADLPYDEMVRLMLAADELHPNDLDRLRATGYLARNYFLFNRNQWMDETVEHVARGFLGLTMNCAKCHDHKYDPVSQTDYYRMRAFFEPYHVRLDVIPGEPDLKLNGIPRAFDGLPDQPTYRFIRGEENSPDLSAVIPPGIPEILRIDPLNIQPVALPVDAWQPERRPWVAESLRQAAQNRIASAESEILTAQQQLAAAEQHGQDTTELQLELQLAELKLAAAQAELESVQSRAVALQMASDSKKADETDTHESAATAVLAAVRAEREHAVAVARQGLAEAELKLRRASEDNRDALTKEVTAAGKVLDECLKLLDEPSTQFTRFTGARWTPTRFFNSGQDDPEVSFPPYSTGRRTALAHWITDRRNPLTARVAVNHLWTRHFGQPLVPNVFDMGRKEAPPVHPELLNWLAAELIESGWQMKHLHRLIVRSAVYRRSSGVDNEQQQNLARDPDNSLLWRRIPQRLESQAVRDAILLLAGALDLSRGGPPVPVGDQMDSARRSLYFFHSNNDRNLFLTMFDEALVKECYRREQSIVPQQALALTNSRLVLDAAPQIAAQLTLELAARKKNANDDDDAFIRLAFRVVLGTEAGSAQTDASLRSLHAWKELAVSTDGDSPGQSARGNLIWVLLNHSDFVTVR